MADYQVFISFKNIDRDAIMAERLYRALKSRGIKVFFSKYSIDETAHADYVDAIDEALDSALLLVAVGTSKKNLTSKWVKSEINQFRTLMNSEEDGKRSIASYRSKDYPESELPSGIKSFQSFFDLNALVRFIEVFLGKDSAFQKKDEMTSLLVSTPQFSTDTDSDVPPDGFYANDRAAGSRRIRIGDLVDGKYRILSKVGQGGMSVVYLGINEKANHQFAIKEFYRDKVKDFDVILNSFRAEVDLMKILDHPAIPKIYDVITTPDSMILVMDFINGHSLQKALTDSGPLSETAALDYARQLCSVLDYLHTQRTPVIYRDLKPANVIVLPNGSIKLIDFGTARHYSAAKLQDTTCLGTIGYAAPEQFGGMGQSDARTDIYNLGATLYHLVTGKSPAEPPYEILPVRDVNSTLSRGLEAIILKCTQRDPDQRFQSAGELLSALDHVTRFGRLETLRGIFSWKPGQSVTKKAKKVEKPKLPVPKQSYYRIPGQEEGIFETTVLPPQNTVPVVQTVQPVPPVRPVSPVVPSNGVVPAAPVRPFAPVSPVKPVAPVVPGNPVVQSAAVPVAPVNHPSAPTEPLAPQAISKPLAPSTPVSQPRKFPVPETPPSAPKPEHPKVRQKVTVHTKSGSDGTLQASIKKLEALDSDSQRIVRELIDRLSRQ